MKTIRSIRYALLAIVTAGLMPFVAGAGESTPIPPEGSAVGSQTNFDRIAALFAEVPRTGAPANTDEQNACGVEGHCSYTTCTAPSDCPENHSGVCDCKVAGSCADPHNPWWPFDNDTHTTYDCDCKCKEDEPKPCTVRNPLDRHECLVEPLPVDALR